MSSKLLKSLLCLMIGFCLQEIVQAETNNACTRLISAAPSVTETLYAAGLGGELVGVTRFCNYPDEAKRLPKIGGFLDPSLEAIVQLRPSAVLLLEEQRDLALQLKRIRIPTLVLEHRTLDGIINSLREISQFCGSITEAGNLAENLAAQLQAARLRSIRKAPLKVLVVVGRQAESGKLKSLFLSGRDGYYQSILDLLAATNPNTAGTVAIPLATPEGVMMMDPDAIIEIVDQDEYRAQSEEELKRAWYESFSILRAVQASNILILRDDYASIPGPRFPNLLTKVESFLDEVRLKTR